MTSNNKFLIVIYTVTAGQHHEELGSDEQEIVLFAYLVLDIVNLKIIDVKCNYVKPKYCEKLSDTAKNEFQLTEQLIEENGQYLENVLEEFNQYVRNKYYDNGVQFHLVCDGQQHLRQVLHPECTNKNITLPDYFYKFYDLKKEFRRFLRENMAESSNSTLNSSSNNDLLERSSTSSLDYQSNDSLASLASNPSQMLPSSSTSPSESSFDSMTDQQIRLNSIFPSLLAPTIIQKFIQRFSVEQMVKELSLDPDESAEVVVRRIKNAANVIINLISNGHVLDPEPETIKRFEGGICSRNEIVDNMTVVRARGLPWQSSDQDIARFFKGLNIHKGGIALCLSQQGRRNGEALIRFECVEHRELALKRHKHHIGQRYIEVYRAKGEDFIAVAGGNNNEAQQFLQKGGQVIVRMRGLPYCTTPEQVVEFFASHKADLSPGGSTEAVVQKGVESSTGRRDKSSIVEQKSVSTERMETSTEDQSDLNNNHIKEEPQKTGKICKPYCRVMHGVDGVLFVKRNGKPSGDCFVLFENEQQGQLALTKHRESIGARYIELFRSSTSEVQQIFNRTMDAVGLKNGFGEPSQVANNAKTSFVNTAKPFLPLHHQSHGSIYQPAAPLGLSMIGNQKQIAGQPTTACMANLQSTLQQQAAVLQPTASLGHLHHASPLGHYDSSLHHQLANHAQHPNQCFGMKQQQPHHAINATVSISGSNLAMNNAHPYVQAKQHLLDSPPSTIGKSAPFHSLCTSSSSPVDSLNTSINGNHQLIAASSNKPTTNSGVRPLLCVQSAVSSTPVLPTASHQAPQQPAANTTTQMTGFGSVRIKDWNRSLRDHIHLRGLPYEASAEQILEFLEEHRSQIVYPGGFHMIYTLNGQFSGEAFLQMRSEYAANQAALAKHHKYMLCNGKKQRYIEVFQCTLDDMLIVLNGGQFINSNLLNGQLAMQRTLNTNTVLPPTHYYLQNHLLSSSHRASHYFPVLSNPFLYHFYPSPPISPTTYYGVQPTMPIY